MRTIGACAAVALFGLVGAGRADACVCVTETIAINEPGGRVFAVSAGEADAIPGATVVLRRPDAPETVAETTTDDNGVFHLAGVPVGTYRLEVSLTGFSTAGLELQINKRRSGTPRAVAVRLDIAPDCPCGIGCATAPTEDGGISPDCLLRKARAR